MEPYLPGNFLPLVVTTDKRGHNSQHQNDSETAEQPIKSVWQNKLLGIAGPIRLVFLEYDNLRPMDGI